MRLTILNSENYKKNLMMINHNKDTFYFSKSDRVPGEPQV